MNMNERFTALALRRAQWVLIFLIFLRDTDSTMSKRGIQLYSRCGKLVLRVSSCQKLVKTVLTSVLQ